MYIRQNQGQVRHCYAIFNDFLFLYNSFSHICLIYHMKIDVNRATADCWLGFSFFFFVICNNFFDVSFGRWTFYVDVIEREQTIKECTRRDSERYQSNWNSIPFSTRHENKWSILSFFFQLAGQLIYMFLCCFDFLSIVAGYRCQRLK